MKLEQFKKQMEQFKPLDNTTWAEIGKRGDGYYVGMQRYLTVMKLIALAEAVKESDTISYNILKALEELEGE
jgi:hypothetical protein